MIALMMEWLLQSVLNSINWQMIVTLAGGGVLAHKAFKSANKPMLAAACLALAGWWFWPQKKAETPEAPGADGGGPVNPWPPYHRPWFVMPKPRPEARPEKPITYREKHDEAIQAPAEEAGEAMVRNDPAYLDPKKREERIKAALAKEAERKRKAEALAAKEKAEEARRLASVKPAPVPSLMTPDMACEMELRMHQRQRARALADLQKVQ
jgi:hypothetical protein